tara:strand:+ start:738 stop:875 length:138 start_codon:yes stop_codon:yes gene_type:complete
VWGGGVNMIDIDWDLEWEIYILIKRTFDLLHGDINRTEQLPLDID